MATNGTGKIILPVALSKSISRRIVSGLAREACLTPSWNHNLPPERDGALQSEGVVVNHRSGPSPFSPDNQDGYHRWRDAKLEGYPQSVADLMVEITDPLALTKGERAKIIALCAQANMAVYRLAGNLQGVDHLHVLPAIMEQLGIRDLDHNLGAGADGLSSLSPGGAGYARFSDYVPYRKSPIGWHTDGYYHPSDRQIRTLCIHCHRPATQGGENDLWDHELAYIRFRDENPELIGQLMDPDIMTIPARMEEGEVARPERRGPVFSIHPGDGQLHMRYTHRTISISWSQDPTAQEAVKRLRGMFAAPGPHVFRGRLEAGWGLICNNVLHTRAAFSDAPGEEKRLLYRAR
ncbi:MAG: TauD/TfdA family dioxygenase, partial [Magnetococcales bacterium]|nr:TauD/TfdA family dioxygenase [Magnetococcales bacterium]